MKTTKLPDWKPAKKYKVGDEIKIIGKDGKPKRVRITEVHPARPQPPRRRGTRSALAILLPILLLIAGCASPQQGQNLQPLPNTMTFNATKETIWPLIMSEVGMSYPVRTVEHASGFLTTDFVNLRVGYNNAEMPNYCKAPRLILPTWNGLRAALKVLVTEPAPGKSTVQIRATYEAHENNVYNTWVACESNGGLENQILKSIYAKLQPAERVDSR